MVKRVFDIIFATLVLLLLAPVLGVVALWVKFDSPGTVFFRQIRVGRAGREFRIYKFRTMLADTEKLGLQITAGKDVRITSSGHFLRKSKLDELPQFINVLLGDMSVVGPRPEVPRYVAAYPPNVRDLVLSVRPGITDKASIEYRYESELLANAIDPDSTYLEQVLPAKLTYYVQYVKDRSFRGDLLLIWQTLGAVVSRKS